MKRCCFIFLLIAVLTACSAPVDPTATATVTVPPATETPEPLPTETVPLPTDTASPLPPTATPMPPTATTAPLYPPQGYGPANFPANINPLTGLQPANPQNLNRRPVVIKIENLPRDHRPHWGLSSADIIYEYYTEYGNVRFAAVFYGDNAQKVGAIRSARWPDITIVNQFKAVFAFGYAYNALFGAIQSSEFGQRLVLQSGGLSCPALCITPIDGYDFLLANTFEMNAYLQKQKIDNTRPNLDGMFFQFEPPAGGTPINQLLVRFSGAIYNRYDYDPASGKNLRFVDMVDDSNRTNPVYGPLTDRLTGQQIAMDNVVVLLAEYSYHSGPTKQIFDVRLVGEGDAFIFRDGRVYPVRWKRTSESQVMTLVTKDGRLFPFKPGTTWYEVINIYSSQKQEGKTWQFTNIMP